ncbi:MAG TPA: DinB family protein [Ktedonobacterales bacterium]|jgi:uncharacterized damage-inducible protein DinB|nr:DinB family protein [Ktedonobacterales bacterium]
MSETNVTLAILSQGWHVYQEHLSAALAPLSADQLALRAAPGLRSIDEIARHVIAVRSRWYHMALGVGDNAFAAIGQWDGAGSPPRAASELVSGMAETWQVMQEALAGFTPADLQGTIERERDGKMHSLARGWVVWHVIEHDLHHGGEISLTLGMNGLQAPDI